MSLEFRYEYLKYSKRPIFRGVINGAIVTCLYDSGAEIPVCCNPAILRNIAKNATKVGTTLLTGFGGDGEHVPIYNLGTIVLMDRNRNAFIFDNFCVASTDRGNLAVELILSAGLFNLCNVFLSPFNNSIRFDSGYNRFTITYPHEVAIAVSQL